MLEDLSMHNKGVPETEKADFVTFIDETNIYLRKSFSQFR